MRDKVILTKNSNILSTFIMNLKHFYYHTIILTFS